MPLSEFASILTEAINQDDENAVKDLLIHRLATDMELYSVLVFPHYCELEFNPYHYDIFKAFKFMERKIRRARAAPRGSAKSTITTVVRPCHDACYGNEEFILFVSSTQPLANKKLKDIRFEVLNNDFLHWLYGIHFPTKKVGQSAFTILSDAGECHMAATGKGSQVRGIRYKEHRPSKLIFDDFESSAEVASETLRKKTEGTYTEDFGKVGNQFTNIEFVGTVLHPDSLLANLLENPQYDSKKFKAIISWSKNEELWEKWREIIRNKDNDNRMEDALVFFKVNQSAMLEGTEVLWPEKESYYDHMLDLEEIGRRAFFKEKQNDPMGVDDPVFETLHWFREVATGLQIDSSGVIIPWSDLRHVYGVIDPSTGQAGTSKAKGKKGDWAVILTGFLDPKGRLLVYKDQTSRLSPTKQIQSIFDHHDKYKYLKFGCETNLFRNLMMENVMAEKRRREKEKGPIDIVFYDIIQTENKIERIYKIEPKVNHGWILFNHALSQDFKRMLEDFPNADHDDGPDALEMLWNLAKGSYRSGAVNMNVMG